MSNTIPIKIKKLHPDAHIPTYARQNDVGADLVAVGIEKETDEQVIYDLGLALEPPSDTAILLFPRSSISKYDLVLSNSVGVCDPGYRNNYKVVFNKTKGKESKIYQVGDRVCQMVLVPFITGSFLEVEELSQSDRGLGGHGSTGT
jgi:dUTP pyrophosphatase